MFHDSLDRQGNIPEETLISTEDSLAAVDDDGNAYAADYPILGFGALWNLIWL